MTHLGEHKEDVDEHGDEDKEREEPEGNCVGSLAAQHQCAHEQEDDG